MARREVPTRPVVGDLVAGVSVGVVLIPQAVAYASLAGLPPATGLLAAFAAPIAAAFFASSPYLATGPVAITSLLVLGGLTGLADAGSARATSHSQRCSRCSSASSGSSSVSTGGGVLAYLMSQPVLAAFTAAAALAHPVLAGAGCRRGSVRTATGRGRPRSTP